MRKASDVYNKGDYQTTLAILRPSARQGDAAARASLGVIYAKGLGVLQGYTGAVKYYRMAAKLSRSQI